MKTTLTTLGIAALLVAGTLTNGCSSSSSTTGTGGNGGTATGNGGSGGSATGNGGSGGSATGNGGSGGSGGAGGIGGDLPLCDATVKDNGPCTAGAANCRKTCGISGSLATKPCTCVATTNLWDCGIGGPTGCTYPTTFDRSCYALSGTPPACPTMTVSNNTVCTQATPCAGSVCSGYVDSQNMAKVGYCACTGSKTIDGGVMNVYLCASTAEWPPAP